MKCADLHSQGYEILQLDECLFNADHHQHARHWAPKGQPLKKVCRYASKKSVVVCGAISTNYGAVHYKYGTRSFKSPEMIEML